MNLQRQVTSEDLTPFLIAWYQKNKRDLPWRESKDPYKIMVSEFMLVQTTVATVTSRYGKFLKEFPNLKSLAEAPLWKVKNAWSGLGYYRRAENLRKACQEILNLGRFPRLPHQLKMLPGFGPYLANAVSSLAFEVKAPVFDVNVKRVLLRIFNCDDPGILEALLTQCKVKPSIFNQAFMELGALICQARNPQCSLCPIFSFCLNRGMHSSEKKQSDSQKLELLIQVCQDSHGRFLLTRRSNQEPFLKNSWGLPSQILKTCPSQNGHRTFRHAIMKYRMHVHVRKGYKGIGYKGMRVRWTKKKDLGKYLYSSLWRKALASTT